MNSHPALPSKTGVPLTVGSVSEAQIIETLRAAYPAATVNDRGVGTIALGIGDDAALLEVPGGRVLASVDTVVEGQDFLREWPCGYRTTGRDVGFKSVAQNLSDLNAMGARPLAAVVALSLPKHLELSWVQGYAEGVSEAVETLGASGFGVAGGDLSSAGEITAAMTVFGTLAGRVLTRSGARPGDVLVVAGATLGRADAGLSLLTSNARQDRIEHWGVLEHEVARALFRPRPPLHIGPASAATALGEGLSALMDVSDGLVRDAARLASASGVRIELDPEAIQREAHELQLWAGRHAGDAESRVLLGGEDHLLLGTCPVAARVPEGFRVIGRVAEGRGIDLDGLSLDPARGFDHFG